MSLLEQLERASRGCWPRIISGALVIAVSVFAFVFFIVPDWNDNRQVRYKDYVGPASTLARRDAALFSVLAVGGVVGVVTGILNVKRLRQLRAQGIRD